VRGSVYIATSLDGFIARKNGDLDWLPGSDGSAYQSEEDFGYQAFMDTVDVLIMGRHTFETVLSFEEWPYGEKRVIVLSSSPLKIPESLQNSVEAKSGSPENLFQSLSHEGHQNAYIDGGNTVQRFLNAGLIRDIIITRIPILIGQGIPLFGPLKNDIIVKHLKTQTYENGFVQSHYELDS
jgi:dihydrofolate reductase